MAGIPRTGCAYLPVLQVEATNVDECSHAARKALGMKSWETQGALCTAITPPVPGSSVTSGPLLPSNCTHTQHF